AGGCPEGGGCGRHRPVPARAAAAPASVNLGGPVSPSGFDPHTVRGRIAGEDDIHGCRARGHFRPNRRPGCPATSERAGKHAPGGRGTLPRRVPARSPPPASRAALRRGTGRPPAHAHAPAARQPGVGGRDRVNPEERLASIVSALESVGLTCLVMGGHAVRYYGLLRYT